MKKNIYVLSILIISLLLITNCSSNRITVNKKYAEVTFDSAPLRTGTSADYKLIGNLSRGDEIKILATSNNWIKIKVTSGKLKGKKGFMAKNFISYKMK